MIQKYKGDLGLLIVAIIWGSGFVAMDIALGSFNTMEILATRFSIATILMIAITMKKLKELNIQVISSGVLIGFFLFMGFLLQTIGLKYTTVSKNAFLTATNVVIVPFIALVVFKNKVKSSTLIGSIITLMGIWILSISENFTMGFGDFLTLLCAFCFAIQIFLTGEFVRKHDFLLLNTIQLATASILSIVAMLFINVKNPIDIAKFFDFKVAILLYIGIFPTFISFLLQTWSQKYTTQTKTAIILSTESVFGTLLSIFILSEIITQKIIIGSIFILMGVIISELDFKK